MFLTGIYGFASSLPNRLWQACSSASTWMVPAAGGRVGTQQQQEYAYACMLCALHAACLYASTQAAYNNYHEHGMLSKIGTSFLHLTTLLVMGLSA